MFRLRQQWMRFAALIPAEAARGAGWLGAAKAVSHVARLGRISFLARFLAPADFGQMSVTLFVLAALDVVTEPGLNMALIQQRGNIESSLNGVFTVGLIRGAAAAVALLAMAPFCGAYWHIPDAVPILQAASAFPLLRALTNPSTVHFARQLNFQKVFIWQISEAGAALAVAIWAGYFYGNAWALVVSFLAGQAVKTIVSYLLAPYWPRITLDWREVGSLFRFGRWAWATSILTYLGLQGDNAVAGRILGPPALGLYQMGFTFAAIPTTAFSEIVAQVAYPLFCKHQRDVPHLYKLYRRLTAAVVGANAVFCGLVLLFAEPLIGVLLGQGWMNVAPTLRILSVANVFRAATILPAYVFYAVDRPRVTFQISLARIVVMGATIVPLALWWGVPGVAISVLLSTVAMIPVWWWRLNPVALQEAAAGAGEIAVPRTTG